MDDIVQSVYDSLASSTEEVMELRSALNELQEKIDSGRYSAEALKTDVYPIRDGLKKDIQSRVSQAMREARELVMQYRQDAEELTRLDPKDLTDDIRLLQPGIVLTPGDIKAMLERNSENHSMTQIILRYAEQNKIDTGGVYYVGGEAEKETADGLDAILSYYQEWIDKPDAMSVLNEFFSKTGLLDV